MDIGDSFQEATDGFFAFLPNLLGFLVILLVGFIVAKLVAAAVGKVLEKMGLDRRLHESDANKYVDRVLPGASPSKGIARVVFLTHGGYDGPILGFATEMEVAGVAFCTNSQRRSQRSTVTPFLPRGRWQGKPGIRAGGPCPGPEAAPDHRRPCCL